MELKEIEKLLKEYDTTFQQWSIITTAGSKKVYHFIDKYGINLNVSEDNQFEFAFVVPKSIFQLQCPECSPFTNKEHFRNMYRKFRKIVIKEGWYQDE